MSDKLISIALCTYNGETFLKEQMDSLVHQDYPNLEIIVVDDCSSDRTIEILHSYSQRFPFIKIYQNTKNLGYIKNFEKAIHLCCGDLIALSDQDDIWLLNKISKMHSSIGDNILLYHDSEFINEQGETMRRFISDIRIFYQGNDSRYFLFENCVSGHSIIFKKELRNYIGSFPNDIYHDWWLAYVASNTGNIGYIKDSLVKYRQHTTASTDILKRKGIKRTKKSTADYQKLLTRLGVFNAFSTNKHPSFTSKMLRLFQNSAHQFLNFKLLMFFIKYRKILLYMQVKSSASKANYILKFLWGNKLKGI